MKGVKNYRFVFVCQDSLIAMTGNPQDRTRAQFRFRQLIAMFQRSAGLIYG